jgi:transmembrane sensor
MNRELVAGELEKLDQIDDEAAWQKFIAKNGIDHTPVVPMHQSRNWRWLAVAAVAVIALSAGWWWMSRPVHQAEQPIVQVTPSQNDIQPGSRKATLTLADGRTMNLDDQQNGTLTKEGGATVNKQGDELVYSHDDAQKAAAVGYHAVTTPTGGFYTLVLPDKSKVWLNAESSIRYPTAFTGVERRVTITGEAYLEVEHDGKPFIVTVNDVQVKVLGTAFNVNAYSDGDVIRTTLLQGSVQIAKGGNMAMLRPGDQASIVNQPASSQAIQVQTVDTEDAVAWKDGMFAFKAAAFTDVMKEIKRWYDGIESIEIRSTIPDHFTATIPRNISLTNMLTILEETSKVKFQLEGKKIIVTK